MGFFDGLTSSVEDLFGGNQKANSASTVAQPASLIQPVTLDQTNAATTAAANGVNSAQALATQLGAGGTQGLGTQDALTTALTNQANGTGPNIALNQLNQTTGQNIASQASLAAGQRGSGANTGLIARQIGLNGGAIEENAVGQAATLEAQQQLAAQQQLQSLAGTQVAQNQAGVNAANTAAETNQNTILGALQGYNTNQVASTGSQNSANANIAIGNAKTSAGTLGGALNGLGGTLSTIGSYAKSALNGIGTAGQNAGSGIANAADTTGGALSGDGTDGTGSAEAGDAGDGEGGATGATGGEVEKDHIGNNRRILASALEKKKYPDHIRAMGEIYHPKVMMAIGGAVVPGDPKHPGKNTIKNDVVPAMLTPKEIVLPLSVTQAKNPGDAAKAFVDHIKGSGGDFKQALKDHVKNRKGTKK